MKEYNVNLSIDELSIIDGLIDFKILHANTIEEMEILFGLANKIRGAVDCDVEKK